MKSRGMDGLVSEAERQGFRIKRTKKGVTIYGKNGGMVTVHLTCTDHRAVRNAMSDMRKIGVEFNR